MTGSHAAGRKPAVNSVPGLDAVIHAQARLRVVATLAVISEGNRLAFPRVQQLLGMTAGNLSTHLRKLEEAGYLEITKTHERRTPVTYLALTRQGRRAFEDYTAALRALLTGSGVATEDQQ
ncbi:MAG: transcriptional regulator [Pseudonocardiaceae bacterium]